MKIEEDLFHLSRLALTGKPKDVQLHVRRVARRCRETHPELAKRLNELLRESPTRSSPLRRHTELPIPLDQDSRLELLRTEFVTELEVEPIYDAATREALSQVVEERRDVAPLEEAGLDPARSLLLTGPPGVGKSLTARWLARELGLPLLVLDLSAVMSSFLGRTGNNVRHVLDYAKSVPCVLLLDELDAVAKRRDDATEVGELKRLVTVLLQEIDSWPADAFLVAATNHSELLDPAVWRRFDVVLELPLPNNEAVDSAVQAFLGPDAEKSWKALLPLVLRGRSFSDIRRTVLRLRRHAVLRRDGADPFVSTLRDEAARLSKSERAALAVELTASGALSQRLAHELTGVSRDTIRKHIRALDAD